MDNLKTLVDSLTTFPLWADIVLLLLVVAFVAALARFILSFAIFLVTAFVGLLMMLAGAALLFIASLIEKMED